MCMCVRSCTPQLYVIARACATAAALSHEHSGRVDMGYADVRVCKHAGLREHMSRTSRLPCPIQMQIKMLAWCSGLHTYANVCPCTRACVCVRRLRASGPPWPAQTQSATPCRRLSASRWTRCDEHPHHTAGCS